MGAFIDNLPRPPTKAEREAELGNATRNPFKLFAMLSPLASAQYFAGWFAWTMDAYDFFCVSLSVAPLSVTFFGSSSADNTHSITTSITLTLLFRSVGALTLGLLSDRYGRRWPMVINLLCIVALQIGTAYCKTFAAFLAVRSLFGIFMGGIWGVATANAMENIPAEARGLMSGILQQGYACGYLIAALVNLFGVATSGNWQMLFYIGAGLTGLAAIVRALLPESTVFLRARQARKESGETAKAAGAAFFASVKQTLRLHWGRCIFAVVLMSFMNFLSHGSQDLYPTYMQQAKGFTAHDATIATIIGNCGAIFGGLLSGYVSQYLGRRLTIIACCLWAAVFIPLWILPSSFGALAAGAFFVQSGVQGAWGVIPIYLSEISPPAFRAVFTGLAYQLGNAASSASAQIEAEAGLSWTTVVNGVVRPDYGKISAVLLGIVIGCLVICCCVGKEVRGARFEEAKIATEADAGGASNEHFSNKHGPIKAELEDGRTYNDDKVDIEHRQ